jgi:hypothetical protein
MNGDASEDNTSGTPLTVSNKAKGKAVVRDNLSEA